VGGYINSKLPKPDRLLSTISVVDHVSLLQHSTLLCSTSSWIMYCNDPRTRDSFNGMFRETVNHLMECPM